MAADRISRMVRWRAAAILAVMVSVLMTPGSSCAQRCGRANSVQNAYPEAPNPILNIDYESAKTWIYMRLSDLLEMNRVAVRIPDAKTNRTDRYEGIPLSQIVSGLRRYRVDVFREFWSFKDKLAVSSSDLDPDADLIVVDTINGRRLGRNQPFTLIAKNKRGALVVVRELAYIRLSDTR